MRTLLRASPRRGRVQNGSALSGGGRRLSVRSYHHRGRVRKAPHGVAAAGYHLSRGWVFGGFATALGESSAQTFWARDEILLPEGVTKGTCNYFSSTHGSGEILAKLWLAWRWLRYCVIHPPGGIVEELMSWLVVSASCYCFLVYVWLYHFSP